MGVVWGWEKEAGDTRLMTLCCQFAVAARDVKDRSPFANEGVDVAISLDDAGIRHAHEPPKEALRIRFPYFFLEKCYVGNSALAADAFLNILRCRYEQAAIRLIQRINPFFLRGLPRVVEMDFSAPMKFR